MNTTQKIIKYLAIAFAVFLIVTIISAILTGLYALSNVLGLRNDNETIGEMKTIEIEESQITTLDIAWLPSSSEISVKPFSAIISANFSIYSVSNFIFKPFFD